MALAPAQPNDRKRVKVYELKNNDWFDRGTGFCTGKNDVSGFSRISFRFAALPLLHIIIAEVCAQSATTAFPFLTPESSCFASSTDTLIYFRTMETLA
jgi:hypothetical protein